MAASRHLCSVLSSGTLPASEPQRRHAVGRERAVVRDQSGVFDQGLRDQKAVEGILVVQGQATQRLDVFKVHGQLGEATGVDRTLRNRHPCTP